MQVFCDAGRRGATSQGNIVVMASQLWLDDNGISKGWIPFAYDCPMKRSLASRNRTKTTGVSVTHDALSFDCRRFDSMNDQVNQYGGKLTCWSIRSSLDTQQMTHPLSRPKEYQRHAALVFIAFNDPSLPFRKFLKFVW